MIETIYTALITGTFSVLGIIISALITNSVVKYRVEQLERKVDKHNDVITRMYRLEQKVEDMAHE